VWPSGKGGGGKLKKVEAEMVGCTVRGDRVY